MPDLKIDQLPAATGALNPATDVAITSSSNDSAGYSYQRAWNEILLASLIANTPAGGISAVTVQGAINELDTDKLDKAGGTMTGDLEITETTSGITQTDAALRISSTDTGANGPTFTLYHNSASPAASDQIRQRFYFNNSLGSPFIGAQTNTMVVDTTSASEDARFRVATMVAGSLTNQINIDTGLWMEGATGGGQGGGTVNAVNYFDDGVNISDLYVNTAGDTMTGALNFDITVQFGTIMNRIDNGNTGPGIALRHTSASPAVSDVVGSMLFQGQDDAAAYRNVAGYSAIVDNITAAGYSGRYQFNTTQAGAYSSRMQIGAGVWLGSATGTDKGTGTLNVIELYANNNLVIDSIGLQRARQYTVATLPAAGTAGRKAAVTDALAPAYGATVAGGGAVRIPVYDNGTNWVTV